MKPHGKPCCNGVHGKGSVIRDSSSFEAIMGRGGGMKQCHGFGRLMAVILLVLALAGCSSVTIKQPLPRTADSAEQARFEGEWVTGDQIIYMRFGSNGIGQFAGVDWKNGQFTCEKGEFIVSKGTASNFLSVRIPENGKMQEMYFFVQYYFTREGELVVWLPEAKAFADAVEKGKLLGTVERGKSSISVVLTGTPEKILAFLNDPANGTMFDYKEPMIFKKLVLKVPRE
jgi:hypothetical protein